MTHHLMRMLFSFSAALVASSTVLAQSYPAKPIRLVTPYSPGGAGDWVARVSTDRVSQALGQPFVIEPRPGAGGNIAAESVVRAPADGYTLLFATPLLAINATLYRKLSFDPAKDLVPIAVLGYGPYVLYASGSVPAKNAGELVAMAKQKPGADQLRVARHRHRPASGRRAPRPDGWCRVHARAVQGLRAGASGSCLGTGALFPERHRRGRRLFEERPGEDARLHLARADEGVPRRADRLGDGAGLRGAGLVRLRRVPLGHRVRSWSGSTPRRSRSTSSPEFAAQLEKRGLVAQTFNLAQAREFFSRETERWGRAVKASGAKIDE